MTALKNIYSEEPAKLYELEKVFKGVKAGKKNSIAIKADEVYSEETVNVMIEDLASRQNPPIKYNTDPAKYQKLSLIVWTLFNTGLRISELTGIRNQDVHLNGKATIKVLGKGSKERTVYLPKDAVLEIREVFESADSEYLFANNRKGRLNRENLTKELSRALKKDYPDFHPHKLRHSFATKEIISKKKSVKAVSKYLGHSSTAITQDLYVHDEIEFEDLEFTERKRI
jgi:integrase